MFTDKNKDKDDKNNIEPVLYIPLSCIHSKAKQCNKWVTVTAKTNNTIILLT